MNIQSHQRNKKNSKRLKDDPRLLAFWDEGRCGPGPDDFNAGWCKWSKNWAELESNCKEGTGITVNDNKIKSICQYGKLKVKNVKRNRWDHGRILYEDDKGCQYFYWVQFECQ